MANRFLNNIRINDAYTFPASDGNDGQVITTDGAGNLAFENISPDAASVIYRDNFTGDGSTVTFDLQNSITDEDQTQIYIDGVYQEKSTYSISGTTITFTTAPISGHSVEVISISSINTGPTVLYQDNFTGNGSDTAFTLGQEIDNEIKTFIFLNGVYQFKNTYTVDGATLTFDTAPANGVAIEVVSIASAVQSDSLQAGAVIIPVKNTHTASIAKGTPVYITGNVGASERLQIAPADASNSAKMPAAGLLLTTLAVNAEGYAITGGYLRNITTDTIDGTGTSSNDTVYVKAGGGLTMTKPTGSNLIQNIAKVARSASGSSGSLLVSSILRTNDIPNLTTGKIWVGSANNTIESGTLHLDESNNRLGINNNSPNYSLDVTGDANISSNVIIGGNLTVDGTQTILNTQTVEVEDNILQLNTTQGSPDTATATTSGISIYRGDGVTQASFIFDDADDTWDLTNNLVVDGNVGIGTDSPATKLNIRSDASDDGILLEKSDGTDIVRLFHDGTSTNARLDMFSGGTATIQLKANGITHFSGGNVGIGTSSPNVFTNQTSLTINGTNNGRLDLKVGNVQKGAVIASANEMILDAGASPMQFYTGSTLHMLIDSSGLATFKKSGTNARFYDGSTSSTGAIEFGLSDFIFGYDSGVFKHKIWDGADYFNAIEYNGPSHRLILVPSEGSVGIGTTTPSALLDFGTSIQDNKIHLYASGNDKYGMGIRGSQFLFYSGGLGDGDGGITFGKMTGTTYAENMRVTNDGNVGIGTNSPSPKLHLKYAGGTYSNDSTSGFINEATTGRGTMRIRSATDNPAELFFDTNGAIRWDISCRNGSSPNLQFYPQAATPALNNVAAHTFELQQNGNVVVTGNGSSGRMGIGTTSPVSKLEVRDALNSTNFTGITVTNSEGGGSNLSRAGIAFKAYDWVQGAIWHGRNMGDGNQGALVLGTNPNTSDLTVGGVVGRMYIINNGNVGIGTASPGAKLSIAAAGADGLQLEADTGSTNNSARLFWKASSGAWAIMNNSQNFSIRSGAVVGSTSGTEKIRLTGYSATSWTSGSDETIKENIISIGNVLDKINDYRCVEYNLIDDETKDKKIGFIAQDWQEDFPQIIEQMENEKIGMKYTETIPILLKAIQELKAEIETLKTQING